MITIKHAVKVVDNTKITSEIVFRYIGWSFSTWEQYNYVKWQIERLEGFKIDFTTKEDPLEQL